MSESQSDGSSLVVLDGTEAASVSVAVWRCYSSVFHDGQDYEIWNREMFTRHSQRDGFRLVIAADRDTVRGFSWGYIGQPGQYWTDLANRTLPPDVAEEWVGGHFEFVELGVLPVNRGAGTGRALHDALLDGITGRCLLSTTTNSADAAVKLYERSGWRRLGLLSPDVQVMGRWASTSHGSG